MEIEIPYSSNGENRVLYTLAPTTTPQIRNNYCITLSFRGFLFSRIDKIRENKYPRKLNSLALISLGVKLPEIKNQQNFQKADSRNLTPAKIKRYTVRPKVPTDLAVLIKFPRNPRAWFVVNLNSV
jgi:hypothetical protein